RLVEIAEGAVDHVNRPRNPWEGDGAECSVAVDVATLTAQPRPASGNLKPFRHDEVPGLEIHAARTSRFSGFAVVGPDGRRVVRRHKVVSRDYFNQIELVYYVTHPDGREEPLVHAFPMRYLFRFEAEHLLARTE